MSTARLRWAVNVSVWNPAGGTAGVEWHFLDARDRVLRFVRLEDQKRALVSQLLQRAACERALGVPMLAADLCRTRGGKPFLSAAWPRASHAPNWNFNVSHEGDYVVLVAEPFCLCGVDVAAPSQLRRQGAPRPMSEQVQLFQRSLSAAEAAFILSSSREDERQAAFQRVWSLKEAMVKARGDGLGLELSRVEFIIQPAGAITMRLDGTSQSYWAFATQQLGPTRAEGAHWVTVARCRPAEAQDAVGTFRSTLSHSASDEQWRLLLAEPEPAMELLQVADLLQAPDLQARYADVS